MLKRLLLVLLSAVAVEQLLLWTLDRAIARGRGAVAAFAEEVGQAGDGPGGGSACKDTPIWLVYSYRLCVEPARGRPVRTIRVQFPSGYLTLVPRDYADRYVFDGQTLAVLHPDGSLEWVGD